MDHFRDTDPVRNSSLDHHQNHTRDHDCEYLHKYTIYLSGYQVIDFQEISMGIDIDATILSSASSSSPESFRGAFVLLYTITRYGKQIYE